MGKGQEFSSFDDFSVEKLLKQNFTWSFFFCLTLFFNHRVKAFLSNIVMGGGNPMMVECFSYKTEFQDGGAGHVHGVLWVKL